MVFLTAIPETDHLMRLVPYGQQIRNPETDEFLGLQPQAFKIRETDDGGLSVTWVEHYGEKCQQTYETAAVAFRGNLEKPHIPKKAYFAVGQAGKIKAKSLGYNKKIRIVHDPDGSNTGHALIRRFSDEDRRLLDALATEVFMEHVAVIDLNLPPAEGKAD